MWFAPFIYQNKMTNSMQSVIAHLLLISNETFLHYFSSNFEASASELLENSEEMFPLYYMDSDVINGSNLQPHTGVLTVTIFFYFNRKHVS